MVRLVTKDFIIYDLVVRIGLFEGPLNADAICNHIIHTIQTILGLKIENWLISMSDCSSTNKPAIYKVMTNLLNAQPVPIYCCTKNLMNEGKYLTETDLFRNEYRNCWKKVVQYKGCARNLVGKTFG